MPGPANALNINAEGLVYFDGIHTFSGIDGGTAGYICVSTGPNMPPQFVDPSFVSGIGTINVDNSGSVTGSTISLFANSGSAGAGSTIFFNAVSGTEIDLVVTDSNSNTIMGNSSGNSSISNVDNTGFGKSVLSNLSTGQSNSSFGTLCLNSIETGNFNSSYGNASLQSNQSGSNNCSFGYTSLLLSTSGSNLISFGTSSGINYTGSESSNIVIGNAGVTGESNVMRIGTQGSGSGQVNSTYIAGVTGASPVDANSPQLVLCDSAGNFTVIVDNTPGYALISNAPNSPSFQPNTAGSITLTGDAGSPITGTSLIITGGTSGAIFTGNGTDTLTESFNFLSLPSTDNSGNGQILINGSTVLQAFNGNFFSGPSSGNTTLSGMNNVGLGINNLSLLTTGTQNVSAGLACLANLIDGNYNTATGVNVLDSLTSGQYNTASGNAVATGLISGNFNSAYGYNSGQNWNAAETSNLCIMNPGVTSENNTIHIGTQGTGDGQQNSAFMAGITSGTPVSANSPQVVLCDNTGNLTVVADPTSGLPLVSNSPNDPTFQVLGISGGGTGLSSTPTDGQLLIGNTGTSSFDLATLTQGAGIIITNAGGTITIAATGGSPGTVTAVQGDDNVPVMPDISGIIYTKGGTGITTSGNALTSTETFSLAVPVVVTSGGTGAITLTNHAVLLGQGTSAVGFVGPSSTVGLPLVGAGFSADPAFSVLGVVGGGSGQNTLTGILTGNGVSAFTASPVNQYQLLVGGASNSVSSISSSTANFIMTSNGPLSNPTFQRNQAGLIWISTTQASAGNYIISLTGGYSAYALYFVNLFPNTNGDLTEFFVSTDGGSTYSSTCQSGVNTFNYNSASAVNINSSSVSYLSGYVHSVGVGAGVTGSLILSTRYPNAFLNFNGSSCFTNTSAANAQATCVFSGIITITGSVNTVKITSPTSGQATFGYVYLYGLTQ